MYCTFIPVPEVTGVQASAPSEIGISEAEAEAGVVICSQGWELPN